MFNLQAVAYSSKAVRQLEPLDLDELLMEARTFNERFGVTGALLFGGGEFFQYFEGPASAVAAVYARIKRSTLHDNIVELLNQAMDARQFRHWYMAFAQPAHTVIQQIANEHWAMALPTLHRRQENSPGLALLLDFWSAKARNDENVVSPLL